jgi:hypothetical protein
MTGFEDLVQRFMNGEITWRDPGGGAGKGSETAQCRAARDEAIWRLSEAGEDAQSLSASFRCTPRSVVRIRARMRAAHTAETAAVTG